MLIHGSADGWVLQLNPINGNIIWQTCIGGSAYDELNSIIQLSDGSLVVAGNTSSDNGDVSGNNGLMDVWVVKLTSGTISWQKCLGGTDIDVARSIVETSGNLVFTGFTTSNDGDVINNNGFATSDFWVVMVDGSGSSISTMCLGGTLSEESYDLVETVDEGYVIVGTSNSNDVDVSGNHGDADCWMVRLDSGDWSLEINELGFYKSENYVFYNILGQPVIEPKGFVIKVFESGYTEKLFVK